MKLVIDHNYPNNKKKLIISHLKYKKNFRNLDGHDCDNIIHRSDWSILAIWGKKLNFLLDKIFIFLGILFLNAPASQADNFMIYPSNNNAEPLGVINLDFSQDQIEVRQISYLEELSLDEKKFLDALLKTPIFKFVKNTQNSLALTNNQEPVQNAKIRKLNCDNNSWMLDMVMIKDLENSKANKNAMLFSRYFLKR